MKMLEGLIPQYLTYVSVEHGGKGFISVRDIGRLIVKLIWGTRTRVFNEFMMRCGNEVSRNHVDKELRGLMRYVR
jgi:hypothetical protein